MGRRIREWWSRLMAASWPAACGLTLAEAASVLNPAMTPGFRQCGAVRLPPRGWYWRRARASIMRHQLRRSDMAIEIDRTAGEMARIWGQPGFADPRLIRTWPVLYAREVRPGQLMVENHREIPAN